MAKAIKKKETFSFDDPGATSVQVVGDFSDWEKKPVNLKKDKAGKWKATIPLNPGTYQYRFIVDGQWRDDPACTTRTANPYGETNCVRQVD